MTRKVSIFISDEVRTKEFIILQKFDMIVLPYLER